MVRTDLITLLAAQHPDLSARDIEATVGAFFNAITTHLAEGGRVEVRGFGSFTTRARDARTGRDPRTGAPVEVNARRIPWFKAGKDLCELINGIDQTELGKRGLAENAGTETHPAPTV
ncbi:integration host factor subunit beta [Sphingomonas sp. AAP5]|nr:integration host factor subunit beta [Sphingomonas sp. AAP5]